jgi:acetyl esterase/lipase
VPERIPSTLGRRELLVGAGIAGAGVALAGCGLFSDQGPDRIRYGSAPSQFGELYEPDGRGPWPVVVTIHGGSWQADETLSLMEDACSDLQRRGYAVWNIEYRRIGELGGGFPGTLDDVRAAVDHVRVLAADRALAPDRVALLGHSAGGTLALWAGGRVGTESDGGAVPAVSPKAAMSLAGVPDLADCAREGLVNGACAQFMGGLPDERPESYALASPIEQVPLGLPQVVVHGRDDVVVPVDQSESYAAAATQAGDPVRLQVVDGANHFSLIDPDQPGWSVVVGELDRIDL